MTRRTVSVFRLFHLPEELIELVLSYLSRTALKHFRTAFGESVSWKRFWYKVYSLYYEASSDEVASSDFPENIGRFVRKLLASDIYLFNSLDLPVLFPACRMIVLTLPHCPGIVFQEYLGSMRNLQCVKFDPMRAPAASWKPAIGWINDDEKSGHVAIIEFENRVTQDRGANYIQGILKTVKSQHLPRLRFDIEIAPAMVGQPVLQQAIPMMSKFVMKYTSDTDCIRSKLGIFFGSNRYSNSSSSNHTVFTHLKYMELSVCCATSNNLSIYHGYNFSSFRPERFPKLKSLSISTMNDNTCPFQPEEGSVPAITKLFTVMWTTVTTLTIRCSIIDAEGIAVVLKHLPNVADCTLFLSNSTVLHVNTIIPYLTRVKSLKITMAKIVYTPTAQPLDCRFLNKLSISSKNLADGGAFEFALDVPNLSTLELFGADYDSADLQPFRHKCASSSIFHIQFYCSTLFGLSYEPVAALVEMFPRAKYLTFDCDIDELVEKMRTAFPNHILYKKSSRWGIS
ncbi:hypothetical protein GQ42DRAFT_78074 [Ramicandelaber brevisporus]|nr:hypothetical protein GQ42DRAFT_78074 [Ramicandelaber brevisporus]